MITVERCESPAAGQAVVTAADMVAGHVSLDVSCLDRLYLNGYVNKLQTPGGVVYFFHDHRGKPIVSPALFEPIGEKFRKDIKDWARTNGIPVIRFTAGVEAYRFRRHLYYATCAILVSIPSSYSEGVRYPSPF